MTNEKAPQVGVHLVGLLKRNADRYSEDLVDATPRAFRCEVATSCPAALHSPSRGSYSLIGATIAHLEVAVLSTRVGDGETAIEIKEGLLNGAVIKTIKKEATALFILVLVIGLVFTLIERTVRFTVALVSAFFIAVTIRPARYVGSHIVGLAIAGIFYPLKALGNKLPGFG